MSETLLAVRHCPPVESLSRCDGSGGPGAAADSQSSGCTPVLGDQRGFDCDVSAAASHLLHLAKFRLAAEAKQNLCQLESSGLGKEFVELTVLLERQEFGC
uniref:Uncharacterized protein n=1 Tax=Macrostomum lignano TaxID=282301 RepID=A0A1I8HYJ7_9PLAT